MNEESDLKNREQKYKVTRDDLLKRQLSNAENFDKAILTLSTASLGVSLSFIKDIIKITEAQYVWILQASWIAFGLAILSTVLSYIVGQRAIDHHLKRAYQYYIEQKREYAKKGWSARFTDYFNNFAALFFIIGLACTIIFVANNIGENDMPDNKDKNPQVITETPKSDNRHENFKNEAAPIPDFEPITSNSENDGASDQTQSDSSQSDSDSNQGE